MEKEFQTVCLKSSSECLYSVDQEAISLLEQAIVPLTEEIKKGRQNPLFQFWDDYLTKVSAPFSYFTVKINNCSDENIQMCKRCVKVKCYLQNKTNKFEFSMFKIHLFGC